MEGFISFKSYSASDGETISVIRFASEEALEAWRCHPEHQQAQRRGRESFYQRYHIEVLRHVRESRFDRSVRQDGGS
jgi:heme-degrading monooxygenase HmoA